MVDPVETPLSKRSMSRNAMLTGWRISPVWRVMALLDAADGKTYARLINEGNGSVQKTVVLFGVRDRRLFQRTAAPKSVASRQTRREPTSPV
ncbi:MAG TPA: hypothetical protein VMB81_32030 [Candidatus Sulfotelmatobacter sp.]|nr:hypothetical protein [Candidatus Sulfotelmatobacter sp.]